MINLRLAEKSDAKFILDLYQNKGLKITLDEILESKLLFLIEEKGAPIGTVRVYGMCGVICFNWGKLLLKNNEDTDQAIEASLAIQEIYFGKFMLQNSFFNFEKNKDNKKLIKFYKDFGAFAAENETTVYFHVTIKEFLEIRNDLKKFLMVILFFRKIKMKLENGVINFLESFKSFFRRKD